MSKSKTKRLARYRRKKHIRKTVRGTSSRPRLCVFRSARHIYAQVIDDVSGRTLVAASSLEPALRSDCDEGANKRAVATVVGQAVASRAKEAGVEQVTFDRNGYLYHGRVKALADAAREGGLQF